MGNDISAVLQEKYPFMTVCVYANDEYIGIVQNRDDTVTTLYDYSSINDVELKRRFIELGNVWWWESNHSIPINLFLKTDWEPFRPFVKTFNNKDLRILFGPICSLQNIAKKKIKRKSIVLVQRME